MSCMPSFSVGKSARLLRVQTIIEQPITPLSTGRISCVVNGLEPITFRWKGPHGKEIQLDPTGSEAYGLAPGRYAISIESADGCRAEISADVVPALKRVIAVSEYHCTNASNGVAFDGSVRATGYGLDQWSRYIWSNGVETTEPVLRDTRPGWYSLSPLPVNDEVPVFVQYCEPGNVQASRIMRL